MQKPRGLERSGEGFAEGVEFGKMIAAGLDVFADPVGRTVVGSAGFGTVAGAAVGEGAVEAQQGVSGGGLPCWLDAVPAPLRSGAKQGSSTLMCVMSEVLPENWVACGLCSAGLKCSDAAPTKAVTAGRAEDPAAAADALSAAGLPAEPSPSFGSGSSHS